MDHVPAPVAFELSSHRVSSITARCIDFADPQDPNRMGHGDPQTCGHGDHQQNASLVGPLRLAYHRRCLKHPVRTCPKNSGIFSGPGSHFMRGLDPKHNFCLPQKWQPTPKSDHRLRSLTQEVKKQTQGDFFALASLF